MDLFRAARSRRAKPPDLAIDLQGDVRSVWLMAATGARSRAGYANTGSASLLTAIVDLDEDVSFVEQNYRAIEIALGRAVPRTPYRWLGEERRARGRALLATRLAEAGLDRKGPIIGIHPGAGRRIKEWPVERFVELGRPARQGAERHAARDRFSGRSGQGAGHPRRTSRRRAGSVRPAEPQRACRSDERLRRVRLLRHLRHALRLRPRRAVSGRSSDPRIPADIFPGGSGLRFRTEAPGPRARPCGAVPATSSVGRLRSAIRRPCPSASPKSRSQAVFDATASVLDARPA